MLLSTFFFIMQNAIVPKVGHNKKRIISSNVVKSQDHFMVRKIPKHIKTHYTVYFCVLFSITVLFAKPASFSEL